jgi:CheY-like chemotaxis protein
MNPPTPTPPAKKRQILVIDDEAAVRTLLMRQLIMLGYAPTLAESGEAGLQLLEGGLVPDLILLDITMPVSDGFVILRQLHEKFEQYRVIMLANSTDIPKATMALNCGASDFMTKPVDLSIVKRTLLIHLPK